MWSVVDAKSNLSKILRMAREGQPQFVGSQNTCVVISEELYRAKVMAQDHDGEWLLQQTRSLGFDMATPSRDEDRHDEVFGDLTA